MEYLEMEGGVPLEGKVEISGSKNATLPIMAASLMASDEVILHGIPDLEDVHVMADGLCLLGAKIKKEGHTLIIDSRTVDQYTLPESLSRRMRASNLIMGALLGKFKEARVAMPGGCAIGSRPMDQHLKGFALLGYQVDADKGVMTGSYKNSRGKRQVLLDFPSVGATENLMMAACLTPGETVLRNVAREPEIVDLQNFLNHLGARIQGAGKDIIQIEGVTRLHGGEYRVIPDRIEAGTFMVGAAMTGGSVWVEKMQPNHLYAVIAKLHEMGIEVLTGKNSCRVIGQQGFYAADLKTMPYPGMPTDMQPQLMALLAMARGTSVIVENIFENRFMHVDALRNMGAAISIEGKIAIVRGPIRYHGATVQATDLRAGAAMVLAGLAAEGQTRVTGLEHIIRGYEHIEDKLQALGARIRKVETTQA